MIATLPGPEYLHPLYTLAGTTLGPEAVIDTLPGYAGSRPVRVGNLANQQVQLDVFGPVVDLIDGLSEVRGKLTDDDWRMVEAMAHAVAARWRGARPRHLGGAAPAAPPRVLEGAVLGHDRPRASSSATRWGRDGRIRRGRGCATKIADDVLTHGWHAEACGGIGAYTTAYDGLDLDAASLHVGLSGLLDPTDDRFQATVTAIEAELRSGSTVYRYHRDDGLPGVEGGFHLCAAWMVEAYVLSGRRTEAEELFEQMLDAAGPTGLLPEEYDPIAERSLGNHPQAYSHLGLIRCAQLLDG